MKYVRLQYSIKAEVDLTREDINLLIEHAKAHYDSRCQMMAQRGGFLYGIQLSMDVDSSDTETVHLDSERIGSLLKLLERPLQKKQESVEALIGFLCVVFKTVVDENKRLNNL